MKKIFILPVLALFLSVSIVNAQIAKKDLLLGGTLGVGTSNANLGPAASNVNIYPRIGYAIGNNSVLSLKFGYAYYKSNSDVNSYPLNNRSNTFTAGLSWKKFYPVKERFGLYTDLYGTYNIGKTKQESGVPLAVQKSSNSGYTAGLNPGVYYLPFNWLIVSVDAGGIVYNYNKNKLEGNPVSHSSAFNVNFLNYFTFGVDFILTKRKS